MTLPRLDPETAIKLHEKLDRIAALHSATDWFKPVMEPFRRLQKRLEGEKYVTGNLIV